VLAALQGIAFANQAKVFACTRLELDAYRAFQESSDLQRYTSYLSNQRGEAFTQSFEHHNNFPHAMTDVTLATPIKDTAELQDTAHYLLDIVAVAPFDRVEAYTSLIPFYGHTPEFKKKF